MRYHEATFRLLEVEPRISPAAASAIRAAESRLGIGLPRSVSQWYALADAIRILADHSNDDPPIPAERFSIIEWRSQKLLPIRHENQGVCTWAVVLDGTDDPPVYVDVDSGGKSWQPQAPTFSTYVYSCVWDYRLVFNQPALLQAQNGVLSGSALEALAVRCKEELQTHGWPGHTQYRFSTSHAAILIWAAEDQADWFIAAPDAPALKMILDEAWSLDDVGNSLYECSPLGKAVLSKYREEHGK